MEKETAYSIIAGSLSGGAAGALISILARRCENRTRLRNDFLAFLEQWRTEMRHADEKSVIPIYYSNAATMKGEAEKIEFLFRGKRHDRFGELCRALAWIKKEELEGKKADAKQFVMGRISHLAVFVKYR